MTAEIEIYEPRATPLQTYVAQINPTSTSISAENPTHTPPITSADKESSLYCNESDFFSENVANGPSLPAQASLSLERICAAFSSGSLGSLEMTIEGTDYGDDSQSDFEDLLSKDERNSNAVPPASLTNLTHIYEAVLDLECSMASDSSFREVMSLVLDGSSQASDSPRPPTPIVKHPTWLSSTPRQPMSSTSTASSSASPSGSVSISILQSKKSNGSPAHARTPILAFKPSVTYANDKLAKSVKGTFYKAVPPSQNVSLLPIRQNLSFQQSLPPSQTKVSRATFPNALDQKPTSPGWSPPSFPCKPRSHTINVVSPLPPNLSTPLPETLSTTSPSKPRSNTVATISPMSSARQRSRLECDNKRRSNTINTTVPVDRPHAAKTISSFARRRSNTLDSYLPVPSKTPKSPARAEAENDRVTVPTAVFMRRPNAKTTPVNTRRMANSPLIPNGCPPLPSNALSPTQYRYMLTGGVDMVVR
jgi:hypothetical protein